MSTFIETLNLFIRQAQKGDLHTASYPKEWADLRLRVSFGMGSPARVPWIAFIVPEMNVSRGFYPVYLYYRELNTLVLAYGISETNESSESWPVEIMNSASTVAAYFDKSVPRYRDSFVFKAYKVQINEKSIKYINSDTEQEMTEVDIEADLSTILEYYKKIIALPSSLAASEISQGLFYMENQLEDFIIHNWEETDLGKKYNLIIEEGELLSQQYRTDIGRIDILARDKATKDYVVIELKKIKQAMIPLVNLLGTWVG